MPAPKAIVDLVEKFQRNIESYRSGAYNETQVRREFIDVFFRELGWDVENKGGFAQAYKDVFHEDAVKVGGKTKAPDYSFRVGGKRIFFVEAKKPSVNIKDDVNPAFQLRRYGWSAKLPVSLLTDFEELAIYDCRKKPDSRDSASVGRLEYLKFTEFVEKWDSLYERFSKQAVLRGDFDRYAESTRDKKGTTEVDEAFLEEISRWREDLAKNLADTNKELTEAELNYAVQITIDRIVFLRMCEDRGIEDYGQLKMILDGKDCYPRLLELFQKADQKYNSGLFHFRSEKGRVEDPDTFTPSLKIDDKVLKGIVKHLYYPDSPYEFSVLSSDILGQVYEQFLGKVIRLTDKHRAVIEDKPEVKKAGGVFYTPTYIVERIVSETLGRALDGLNVKQVAGIKVVDPACGSGSFLLGAYQYLLDWHLQFYLNNSPEKLARSKEPPVIETTISGSPSYRLTTSEKKRILLNGIFGVDIDPQAVEVTKLSLLLKVLEGENNDTLEAQLKLFQERALPDLALNIKCGNSLIEEDYSDLRARGLISKDAPIEGVREFNWKAEFPEVFNRKQEGFDVVIGNPPYDVMEKQRGNASWPHTALSEYVRAKVDMAPALGGKLNLYRFFIVRSLRLCKPAGHYGMIVPLSLLADISCASTRRHFIENTEQLSFDCFPQKDNVSRRVFEKAKLSTVVFCCQRSKRVNKNAPVEISVHPGKFFEEVARHSSLTLQEIEFLDPKNIPIPLVNDEDWNLCKSIYRSENVKRLGDIKDFTVTRGEINQTIYRDFITSNPAHARLLKGVEVARFYIRKKLSQGEQEWFNETQFLKAYKARTVIKERRIATQRITGVDERYRIVATIMEPVAYFADSTNSIKTKANSSYKQEYLLGLLNSTLYQWRFKLTSTNNNVGTNELKSMPFYQIDFDNESERTKHDGIVSSVKTLMALSAQIRDARLAHEKTELERKIGVAVRKLDNAVFDLFELEPGQRDLVLQTLERPTMVVEEAGEDGEDDA